jgi:hypothetical protein
LTVAAAAAAASVDSPQRLKSGSMNEQKKSSFDAAAVELGASTCAEGASFEAGLSSADS